MEIGKSTSVGSNRLKWPPLSCAVLNTPKGSEASTLFQDLRFQLAPASPREPACAYPHVGASLYNDIAPAENTKPPETTRFRFSETPKTLYSWMSLETAEALMGKALSGKFFKSSLERPIFAFPTPAGSFGYGSHSVRFKLRDDVVFKRIEMFAGSAGSPRTSTRFEANTMSTARFS